jgi:aminoglycoside phosphotransferase (APT) family kinase protein
MNATLAALHAVDWRAAGLAGFGREGGYFARQIRRWSQQYESGRTRELPDVEKLIAWLPAQMEDDSETALCHGDYRLGNLMIHPVEPRVVAVLDWELSTLGHPMADLAFNCILYHSTAAEYGGVLGADLDALGIPGEAAYVARYVERSGRPGTLSAWHLAFALFRFAMIFEGIAGRAARGNAAAGAEAVRVGHLAAVFARRAVELVGI